MLPNPEQQKQLLRIRDVIISDFAKADWDEIGLITGSIDLIRNHGRLLRSMDWQDEDYPGNIMDVLLSIISRDMQNLKEIEAYIDKNFSGGDISVSSTDTAHRIYFTPSVFQLPSDEVDFRLVAIMMPFDHSLMPVYEAIKLAVSSNGLHYQRVDDMWEDTTVIQDIFSLIFRSNIVVCDFSGKNPNVFYECGIAHTLGKHVVPIAQHESDVPFDLRHHRYLQYHNNAEGLTSLKIALSKRLKTLSIGSAPSAPWAS